MSRIRIGDFVKFESEIEHKLFPDFYPATGTIGVVTNITNNGDLLVKWPKGSTVGDGCWFVLPKSIKRVCESKGGGVNDA